jgi:hypothetical protein
MPALRSLLVELEAFSPAGFVFGVSLGAATAIPHCVLTPKRLLR